MCGIAGVVNTNGIEVVSLKKMTDVVRHRGPDGEGFSFFSHDNNIVLAGGDDTPVNIWSGQTLYQPTEHIEHTKGSFQVGFGHRRLSILDLTQLGHQPMTYEAASRYWITYNGEVYNYIELRQELIGLGYHFQTDTDTEVIIAAFTQWGIDCLQRFNGMWALAIYDKVDKEIFLARDRFGIKPLYYWFSPDNSFYFASEIKQFTVLPGWEAILNRQRAYDYLVYSITDHTTETMFENVFQIQGGHYFKVTIDLLRSTKGGKITAVKWYELKYKKFPGSFAEAALGFNKLFKTAVDLHLRADVPTGTALSGGLDSSAIVCEVNNILVSQGDQHLQKTFSSCSTDERFNEKKWIDIVVAHTAVEAHYVYPRYEDIFSNIAKLTWMHDEPYQSQSAFLGYHVFQLTAKNGVKVLLNGQGADEYLGGYGQFTIARYLKLFRKMKWRRLVLDIQLSRKYSPVNYANILSNMLWASIPDTIKKWFSTSRYDRYKVIKSLINSKQLGASDVRPYDFIPMKQGTVQEVSKHFTFFSTLPKYLKWEDRNSMANSVEARVPFLDYRLVEFTYNLPNEYLEYGGERKRILREGLKDILPEKIKNRKDKKGFITPEERWVKEDNPALFRSKLQDAIELSKGIIKPEALHYFDEVVKGTVQFDYTYWRLIQFGEWMRVFNVINNY